MVKLSIETIGEERFVRGFNRYVEQMKDFSEVFKILEEDFHRLEEENFEAQGRPAQFKALSPKYAEWKELHYPGRKIMQLTGRLKRSLTGGNAEGAVRVITPKNAEFGSKVEYAHRHQMGTHGMPQRKIVQLTDEVKDDWAKTVQGWAYQKLRGQIA